MTDEVDDFSLETVGYADWPKTRDVLMRGYPWTDPRVWDAGFERLKAVPPATLDAPLGQLMHGPQGAVGVVLMLGSERARFDGGALHLNASGWAILPSARERALWMARHVMPDAETVYTSITPVAGTEAVVRRLKFRAISHQLIRVATARYARAPGPHARVLNAQETLAELRDQPIAQALHDHARLDCMVCAVDTPKGLVPMVFRPRRRMKYIPVADLVYTPSQAVVTAHVAALAKHFLRRGYPFMEFEAQENLPIDFRCTRLFRRRFARGPYLDRGTNHLYSELVYVDR